MRKENRDAGQANPDGSEAFGCCFQGDAQGSISIGCIHADGEKNRLKFFFHSEAEQCEVEFYRVFRIDQTELLGEFNGCPPV